jgi:archaellum component FlaC
MSEKEILQDIKNIYKFLTEQEPTPDDEIDAREKLITKFKSLKSANTFPELDNIIGKTLRELEDWDTLDLWFLETTIPKSIKELIELVEKPTELVIPEVLEEKKVKPAETPQIDIKEIVSQVSEQFKGEIGGLKDQIAQLQKELEKKDETIKKSVSAKKAAPKAAPKAKPRLAPPKIKIPSIKKPQKLPQVTISLKPKEVKKKVEVKPKIESVKVNGPKIDITQTMKKIVPLSAEASKIEPVAVAKPKIEPVAVAKPKIEPVAVAKPKIEPVAVAKPKIEPVAVAKPDIEPVAVAEPKIEAITVEKPKIEPVTVEKPKIEPVTVEKPVIEPATAKKPFIEAISTEKPKIETIDVEEPKFAPFSSEQPIIAPFTAEKPKITPVMIEEVETSSVKSSGADLFNVFSSVGSATGSVKPVEPVGEVKSKKKRADKKRKRGERPGAAAPAPNFGFGDVAEVPGVSAFESGGMDGLPADKDTLYQDLIALEGRRYSLEKGYKELETSYQKGSIDDFEYKSKSDELKFSLNEITERINKIRRIISSI